MLSLGRVFEIPTSLAAGLRPDPLGGLTGAPDPLATIGKRGPTFKGKGEKVEEEKGQWR